ncbi:MAG TPA: hypothetical protein VHQ45_20035, partial [Gemmatimonadaceae bacterium]|nr:hypothetical protein [Gemmatimonadaceae bacterium]
MTVSVGSPAAARRLAWVDEEVARNATCLFAVVAALLLVNGSGLLNDPDSHWHVAVGRLIWETRAVPWTDPFSHTFAGAPWIAKEWLAQLLLYGAHALGGWWGVVVLTATTAAASFALLFGWLQLRIRVPTALIITLVALILSL